MDRREMLLGTLAGAVATAASGTASAAAAEHQHHHHGAAKHQKLIDSAAHCVSTGEICLDHCHDLLGDGDKAMADCARSVAQLNAICSALRSVAAQNGTQLVKLAKVALDICKECEDECRKHEKKHAQCKDCADACADCAKHCKALTA
jgi:Cys-rich four helix bundle protein (predicted Tat secretion target)